jgi:hypothetical protein
MTRGAAAVVSGVRKTSHFAESPRRWLNEACGDITPAEFDAAYYSHNSDLARVSLSAQ